MSFRISPADVGVPGDLDRCATHQLLQREHGEKSCGPVQFMSEQKHSAVAQRKHCSGRTTSRFALACSYFHYFQHSLHISLTVFTLSYWKSMQNTCRLKVIYNIY